MNFKKLLETWPSPFIARSRLSEATGGVLNARTMANHDSMGTGIKGKTIVGGRVVYEVARVVEWLEGREKRTNRGGSDD